MMHKFQRSSVMVFMNTSNYQITEEQPSSDNCFMHLHIQMELEVISCENKSSIAACEENSIILLYLPYFWCS